MTQPTGSIRPLQFPLDRNDDIESETPNTPTINFLDLSDWSSADEDERVNIILNLSLNEYVALATCVDVGRDLAYGDNSIYLWWLWTRSLLSMDICNDIIACIENSESGVSEAILSLVGGNNADDLLATTAQQDNMSLIGDSNPTCDKDILFGQCVQLVDYLNEQHTDLFEIIEVSTNIYEATAAAFGTQSGSSAQAISAFISWITFVQASIAEVYAAQITTAYKEALACEWFCLASENDCELTPDILFNSMSERMASVFGIRENIINTINFLVTGTWSGQQIADFMFYANFAIRAQVGNWLGNVAWYDIEWHMVAFANDPDSDWDTICDDCGWVWNSNFAVSENIWSPFNNVGDDEAIWTDGIGYTSADAQNATDTWSRLIFIETSTFSELTEITQVRFEYSLTKGSYSSDAPALHISLARNAGGRETQQSAASVSPAGSNLFYTFNLTNNDYEDIWLYVRSSASNGSETYSGSCELHSVRVMGIGFNPFE